MFFWIGVGNAVAGLAMLIAGMAEVSRYDSDDPNHYKTAGELFKISGGAVLGLGVLIMLITGIQWANAIEKRRNYLWKRDRQQNPTSFINNGFDFIKTLGQRHGNIGFNLNLINYSF